MKRAILVCRKMAMPWRQLIFWAMPWLPSARENKGYHDRLYAAWGDICDNVRGKGPYSEDDNHFYAIIGRMAEPDTGEEPSWLHNCMQKLCKSMVSPDFN